VSPVSGTHRLIFSTKLVVLQHGGALTPTLRWFWSSYTGMALAVGEGVAGALGGTCLGHGHP
jgi:hypothetical protein